MSSNESNQPLPSAGIKGKWFVILLAPLLLIISVWLMYLRVNFKHPTNLMPSPTMNETRPK